jgi:hypothetical protein
LSYLLIRPLLEFAIIVDGAPSFSASYTDMLSTHLLLKDISLLNAEASH